MCASVGEGKRKDFWCGKVVNSARKELDLEVNYSGFEGSADS
jgi:hypothetical protein